MEFRKENFVMKSKSTLKIFALLTILAVAAPVIWALVDPEVDGVLSANEYSTSQSGVYSRCWYRWFGGDFYICNDWYNAVTNYNPATNGDYNIFTWDSPSNYRLLIRSNGQGWLQKQISGTWTTVTNNGAQRSDYTTTPGHPTAHPVWELKIDGATINVGTNMNPNDPKQGGDSDDDDECENAFDTTALGFGTVPSWTI
jgi:hypothetical protein